MLAKPIYCLTGNYASRATNSAFLRDTEKHEGQTVIKWNTFITINDKILPQFLMALPNLKGPGWQIQK
jgi:hypothetical protein